MKRLTILFAVLAVFLWVGSAWATSFGDLKVGQNITINDTIWNSIYDGGSPALNQGGEDNETERNNSGASTITAQDWDLEGIFLNSSTKTLTIIGGKNFQDTYYPIGDLFVGEWGSPDYDHGKKFVANYVLDFSRTDTVGLNSAGTFNIFGDGFTTTGPTDVPTLSNPWEYKSDGEVIGNGGTYSTGYIDNNKGMPFDGWKGDEKHYFLQIVGLGDEWSQLINGPEDIFHITWKCGNDTLRGSAPVPEPATMLLFGVGLCGLAFVGRKKLIRQG